ncbi:MAG TPA: hypothetical protein VIJ12_04785, partial [Candidatus Baltobacteraceae bacterium]
MTVAAPRRVAPKNAEELSDLLAACDRAGEKVGIEGGGTLRGMGAPPAADVIVQTTKLKAILSH